MNFEEKELKVLRAIKSGAISKEEGMGMLSQLEETRPVEVEDGMHPDIGFLNRAIYKNFSDEGKEGIEFLKRKYPDLKFRNDASGRVIAKGGKSGDKWMRLDEKGFGLQDISDVGYDIVQGGVETAGTVAGGLAGGMAGLVGGPVGAGAGALGGASLAGGATAGLMNSAKQGIGNLMGARDGFNTGELGTDMAFGAVSPLLLGTGVASKHVAKQALKSGMSEAGKKALMSAQRGAVKRGINFSGEHIAPRLGALASGDTVFNIKYAKDNINTINAASKSGGGNPVPRKFYEDVSAQYKQQSKEAMDRLAAAKSNPNLVVSTAQTEKPLLEMIADYEARAMRELQAQGEKQGKKSYEYKVYKEIQKKIKPLLKGDRILKGNDAAKYLDSLNSVSDVASDQFSTARKKEGQKAIARAAKIAAGSADDQMKNSGTAGLELMTAKKRSTELLNMKDDVIKKYFKQPNQTQKMLNNINSPSNSETKALIKDNLNKLNIDLEKPANQNMTLNKYMKPTGDAVSSKGVTATARAVPLGAAGATAGYAAGLMTGIPGLAYGGGALGAVLGSKGGSAAALRGYMNVGNKARKATNFVQELGPGGLPQAGANIWQNILMDEERRNGQ